MTVDADRMVPNIEYGQDPEQLDLALYGLDDANLTPEEIAYKRKEMQLNADLDKRLLQNPDKIPRAVFFIIPNEFCERWTFYGIKSLMKLYFQRFMRYSPDSANTYSSFFSVLSYFAPLGGAAVSDSFLGKFRTILYLSIVYFIGTVLFAVTAIPGVAGDPAAPSSWGVIISLLLIAIGTGGIKPCVSSFGGDQYLPIQEAGRAIFFSMFYFTINFGTTFSKIITPLLKEDIGCFGRHDCYSLAFGIPAVLMFLAIVFFVFGKNRYRIVPPTGDFVPGRFVKACCSGAYHTLFSRNKGSSETLKGKTHWVYNARGFSNDFLEACVMQVRVNYVLLPVIVFWTLFDQQDSTWTDQLLQMNRKIGSFTILPEQMSVLNPILVMVCIPFTYKLVYPFFEKRGLTIKPLMRMFLGMAFAALAFMISGVLQLWIDSKPEALTVSDEDAGALVCINGGGDGSPCVHVMWQIIPYVVLTFAEIFVSISGLEFAYAESHKIMKSTSSSFWLLTVALGNVIFIAVENAKFLQLAGSLFFYGGLMGGVSILFLAMSWSYKYVTPQGRPAS